jgi:tellurite resistance protein
MSGDEAVIEFEVEPQRLSRAVEAVLGRAEGLAARFRSGAEGSMTHAPGSAAEARTFQTLLELGYLVASADGFAEQERASLSALLERVTSSAVGHDALDLHFRDLDQQVEVLGRHERIARAAAEVEPEAVSETIGLVATIAMSDGCLSGPEYAALVELGRHLALASHEVRAFVDTAAGLIKEGL